MKKQFPLFALILIAIVLFSGCYTLSGISIDPTVKTFKVDLFENNANFIEPTYALDLTEGLKERIINNSRLVYADKNPDIEFVGTIVSFKNTSEAPQAGATAAINRLTVRVKIELIHHLNEEESWKKTMPARFSDYGQSELYTNVKDDLIEDINDQLLTDIFNEAFTNW